MRDILKIFLTFLMFLTLSACNTDAPVDLQQSVDNNYKFSYSLNNITLYKNLSALSIKPLLENSSIYTYSISPTLPNGLVLNQNNGVISGVPQLPTGAPTIYTVTAKSHLKVTVASITIDVKDEPLTNISYPVNPIKLDIGVFSPMVLPVVTGGTPTHFSIEPNLDPSLGLTFNTTTGQIIGAPLALNTVKTYTVTAYNSGNQISVLLILDIRERAPLSVTYSSTSLQLTRGNPMTPLPPIYNGGRPTKYTVTPELPKGFALNETTGEISGTPALASPLTNYTIIASNTGGSFSFSINISVTDIPPNFGKNASGVYDFVTYTAINPGILGNSIVLNFNNIDDIQTVVNNWNALNPTNQVAHNYVAVNPSPTYVPQVGTVKLNGAFPDFVSYGHVKLTALFPANPSIITLAFDGIKTLNSVVTTWNTANPTNTVSYSPVTPISPSGTLTLSGGLSDQVIYDFSTAAVDALSYNTSSATLTLYKDIPMGTFSPSYEYVSGIASSFSVDKVLPPGIYMDPATGTISGTPVGVISILPYQIIGTNQIGSNGGSDQFTLFIQVVEKAPTSFYYDTNSNNYIKDQAITINKPHFHGSDAYYYEVSPPLPAGLTLDFYNGEIAGTPVQPVTPQVYTITVTNGGGTAQALLTIGVQDQGPGLLTYTNPTMETICNTPFIQNFPQNAGTGIITNYYHLPGPVLPAGVTINPTTGIIGGLPTQATATTEFQIMGTNNSGSTSTSSPAIVYMTVKPEKPDFRYDITQAKKVYDGVTYTAKEYGQKGNDIKLTFNGTSDTIYSVVSNWNLNYPSNKVLEDYSGNDMLKIPPAGTVRLENGSDVIKLFMGQVTTRVPTLTSCALGEYFSNYSLFPSGMSLNPVTGELTSTSETKMTRRQKLSIGATNITDTTIKSVEIQVDYLYDQAFTPASSTFLKFDKTDNFQDLVMFTKKCTGVAPPEICDDGHLIVFKGNSLNEYELYSDTKISLLEVPVDPFGTPEDKKFKPATNYAFNLIVAVDFNADGADDLVLYDKETQKLLLLQNYQANSATIRTFKFVKSFTALPNLTKAITKDLDINGKFEVTFTNNSHKVNVLYWNAEQNDYALNLITFNALDSTSNTDQDEEDDDGSSYGVSSIVDFTLIDANGDGEFYDIVAADANKNRACVIVGEADTVFGDSCTYGFKLKGKPMSLTGADFNQDGLEDIAVLLETGKVDIYFGDGENFSSNYSPLHAEPEISKVIFASSPVGTKIASIDTNDDTFKDIVVTEPGKRTYTLEWDFILNDFRLPLVTEISQMNINAIGLGDYTLPGYSYFACNNVNKSCGITQFQIGTHPIYVEPPEDDDW